MHKKNENFKKKTAAAVMAAALCFGGAALAQDKPKPAAAPAAKPAPATPRAQPLGGWIVELMKTDRRVAASSEDYLGAVQRERVALGEWFPTLKVTAWTGKERVDNPTGADTRMHASERDVTLTQLVADFGKTSARVAQAGYAAEQAKAGLAIARQGLILDAASAYVNLHRAAVVYEFATQSEANLAEQLRLEQARQRAGGGVSTDVLQVQAQYAGATARRARAQSVVQLAAARFVNVFGRQPDALGSLVRPAPAEKLPESLEAAQSAAVESNPAVKNASLTVESAREGVRAARAESFFPKIEAIYDHKSKDDVLGTAGHKTEALLKGQLTWSFNLGFTGVNSVRASDHTAAAARYRLTDAEKNAREQASIGWQNLAVARQTVAAYGRQVSATRDFLDLARKERQLGKRSLIDVLNGETVLLNAQSDLVSAELDELLAGFGLLQSVGRLDEAAVSRVR